MLLAAVFAFASCDKDDDNNNTVMPVAGDFFLKAKVNGADYNNSAYFAPSATINNGVLNIQSSGDTGNSVQIQVQNYDEEGTYTSGNNDLSRGYINYMTLTPFKTYTSVRGTGTVTITEVTDTSISGTFSATAPENSETSTASVTITEGQFKVKRQ